MATYMLTSLPGLKPKNTHKTSLYQSKYPTPIDSEIISQADNNSQLPLYAC